MEEGSRHVEGLLDLGLLDSAETMVKWLLADRRHSTSQRAAYEELLGDTLSRKGDAGAAQRYYSQAVRGYNVLAAIEGWQLLEARRAKVTLKLAKCIAGASPKRSIALLEEIPLEYRDASMHALLGKLYAGCNEKEAALAAYKACLRKCPLALEAALAMADLGAPVNDILTLLRLPEALAASRITPVSAAGEPGAREATLSKPSASHSTVEAALAGEKRPGGVQQSPDRKRVVLEDRAALRATDMNSQVPSTADLCQAPLRSADENGKQGSAAGSGPAGLGKEAAPPVLPDLSSDSGSWDHLLLRGRAHEMQGRQKEAALCYGLLASQRPDNVEVLLRLASMRAAGGDASSAIELFNRCRRLEEGLQAGMDELAMLLYYEGKLPELRRLSTSLAGRDGSDAKDVPPSKALPGPEAWVAAAACLLLAGCVPEASKLLDQAESLEMQHWALSCLRGDMLARRWQELGMSEWEGRMHALAAYQKSYRLRPSWRAKMGCSYAVDSERSGLKLALEAANESGHPEALAQAALRCTHAYRPAKLSPEAAAEAAAEAHRLADRALEAAPHSHTAIFAKADLMYATGRWEEARELLAAKLEASPHAGLHAKLGVILQQMGRSREAVAHYQAALAMDPDLPLAKHGLAGCHLGQGTGDSPERRPQDRVGDLDYPTTVGGVEPAPRPELPPPGAWHASRGRSPSPGFGRVTTPDGSPATSPPRADTPRPALSREMYIPEAPPAPRRPQGSRGDAWRLSEPGGQGFRPYNAF